MEIEKNALVHDGIYLSITEIDGEIFHPLSLRKVNPESGFLILEPRDIAEVVDAVLAIKVASAMITQALKSDYTTEKTSRLALAAAEEIEGSLKILNRLTYWKAGLRSVASADFAKTEEELGESVRKNMRGVFSVCSVENSSFIPFCCTNSTIMSKDLSESLQKFAEAQLQAEAKEKGIPVEEVLKMIEKFKVATFDFCEKKEEEEDPFKVTPEEEEHAVKEMFSNIKTLEQSLKEMERAIKETPDLSSEEQTPSSQYVEDTMDS